MPVPFILAGLAVASAVAGGVKKSYDAKKTYEAANEKQQKAEKLINDGKKRVERAKVSASRSIEKLGKAKLDILSGSIAKFVSVFGQIKEVELHQSIGIDEIQNFQLDKDWFANLSKASINAKDIMDGGAGGVAAGTFLAAGAYSLVHSGLSGVLITSTGTAITGLTGVAATNATLAWLGGGSLAAGGLGVAGGMMVLGGLVTAPMLLITGFYVSKKADEAYSKACAYYDKTREFDVQTRNIDIGLKAVEMRASQICGILRKLNEYMLKVNVALTAIVQKRGTNYCMYSFKEQKIVGMCAQLAKTIKIILDTSLLSESGDLTPEAVKCIENSKNYLEKWE